MRGGAAGDIAGCSNGRMSGSYPGNADSNSVPARAIQGATRLKGKPNLGHGFESHMVQSH